MKKHMALILSCSGLLVVSMACGTSGKKDSPGPGTPPKKSVSIETFDGASSSSDVTLNTVSDISRVKIKVVGVESGDVTVGLLGAPSHMSLSPQGEAEKGVMSYGLTADSLETGTYVLKVVARDVARCKAKEKDNVASCSDASDIDAVNADFDTVQELSVTLANGTSTATGTSTSTTTSTSTSGDTSTDGSGGGLFSKYCESQDSKFKTFFCNLVSK